MSMKKKLLYSSPLPPLKSGISDYSVLLAAALSKIYDITFCVDQDVVESGLDIPVINYKDVDFKDYELYVYNLGNNPDFHSYIYDLCLEHPGMIILHDLSLYYLFVGHYQKKGEFYSKLYEVEGKDIFLEIKNCIKNSDRSLLEQKSLAAEYRFNKEIITSKNRIMVHSEYNAGFIRKYNSNVKKINHVVRQDPDDMKLIERKELYAKYNLPSDAFIIASFGFIAETKMNHLACKAVLNLIDKSPKKICYVMVGEGGYVDQYIDNRIIFKTGYASMEEFNSFLVYSDLILNLRHPSMGETSGALVRALQVGKACIINDEAWFSEIPDDCAIKISVDNVEDELQTVLMECLTDESKISTLESNAREYIEREYATEKIVKEFAAFIEDNNDTNAQ